MRPPSDLESLQAYLDGELAPEQAAALEARLRSDPRLADALLRLARDEAVLTEWARSALALHAADADAAPAPVFLPIPLAQPVPPLARPYRRRLIALFAGAAAAAALLFLYVGTSHHRPAPAPAAPEQARLEEVQGEVFVVPEKGDPFPAKSGQRLASGQGLSTRGDGSFAVLAVPNTWRLELGADTTIRLPAESPGERVFLEQGIVAADVGPQPGDRPMIVATPHAEARLLSAKSSFASTPAETRVEPEKGKVRLVRKSDGRAVDVGSGYFAVAAGATDAFTPQRLPTQVAEPRAVLTELSGQVVAAAYSPDGAVLAVGCVDGSVKLWDVARSAVRHTLPGAKRAARALAFAPVGNLLAAAYDDRTVKLWDPVTGTEITTLKDFRASVGSLAFAPTGALLATGGPPGKGASELRLWDTKTWKEIPLPREQTGNAGVIAFAPEKDNPTLAVAGKDNSVRLWDVNLRQVRQTLTGAGNRLNAVAVAPDGKLVVAGGKDRSVRLWDPATGKELRSFPVACCEVRALAFAPDGKLAVAADHSVVLWDLNAGRERLTLKAGKHAVSAVLFAPGGKTLVTVGGDRVVRFWDAMPPEMPRLGL